MKKNMGSLDKTIRVIIALVFIILYAANIVSGTLGIVLLVAGIIFLVTSIVSYCPLYTVFGFKTCKAEKK